MGRSAKIRKEFIILNMNKVESELHHAKTHLYGFSNLSTNSILTNARAKLAKNGGQNWKYSRSFFMWQYTFWKMPGNIFGFVYHFLPILKKRTAMQAWQWFRHYMGFSITQLMHLHLLGWAAGVPNHTPDYTALFRFPFLYWWVNIKFIIFLAAYSAEVS